MVTHSSQYVKQKMFCATGHPSPNVRQSACTFYLSAHVHIKKATNSFVYGSFYTELEVL